MRTEFEKNMKISSELLSYCHLHGAREFHLDLVEVENATHFTITASPASLDEKEMKQLLKRLKAPRRREIEQNYWGLGGRSEITSELLLIGNMVDEAFVTQHDNAVTIKLIRNN
jgi:hypothetical protein